MNILKSILFIAAIPCIPAFVFAQSGADLFHQNCAACHSIGNGRLVGPDLKGILPTHPKAWFYKWIKSSQTLVKSGDKTAVDLFKKYQIPMPDQALTKAQITNILGYIYEQSGGALAAAQTAPTDTAAASAPAANATQNNGYTPLVNSGTPFILNKPASTKMKAGDVWQASKWWLLIIIVALIINVTTYIAYEAVNDHPVRDEY